MKKISVLAGLVLLLAVSVSAQESAFTFDDLKAKYENAEGCVVMDISAKMLRMGMALSGASKEERAVFKALDMVRLFAAEKATEEIYADVDKLCQGYVFVGELSENGQEAKMYKAADDSTLLVCVKEGTEVTITLMMGKSLDIKKLIESGAAESVSATK